MTSLDLPAAIWHGGGQGFESPQLHAEVFTFRWGLFSRLPLTFWRAGWRRCPCRPVGDLRCLLGGLLCARGGVRACCRCVRCVVGDCRAGLALAAALGRSGAGEAGQGLAAAPTGSGREPGGGAALGFFLPGVPCGEDALVADDQQRRGEQHEGCQAHEAAAGDVAGGGVLDGGEAAFGAGAAGVGAAPGRTGSRVSGKRRDKPAWRRRWKSSAPKE